MTERMLKIAAIGLDDPAEGLLDIARVGGLYEVVAVGDSRQERLEVCGRKFDCPVFADHRQLIISTEADFLLFGSPVHQCADFIQLALQEGFHVLKPSPPALNFTQLAEFYRLAEKHQQLFLTLQNGRFRLPFEHVRNHLVRSREKEDHSWHLVSAVCHVPTDEPEGETRWLTDPNMAGGGVLLQNCYDLIDELLLCFGLPQKVYALTISQAPDRQQRMSLTEDTAIVTMQFTDALIAQICASRTLGPARRHLRIHGKQHHLTATEEEVVLYDNGGNLLEQKIHRRQFTQPATDDGESFRCFQSVGRLCALSRLRFRPEDHGRHRGGVPVHANRDGRRPVNPATGRYRPGRTFIKHARNRPESAIISFFQKKFIFPIDSFYICSRIAFTLVEE
jgi:predicted dehydrogenase